MTTVSVKSPFFEYSRFTVGIAPAPVEVQEIVFTCPTLQTSVPTGLVTVSPPLTSPVGTDVWSVDRKSTRLNSSHGYISYAVFCLKKKKLSLHEALPIGSEEHASELPTELQLLWALRRSTTHVPTTSVRSTSPPRQSTSRPCTSRS